MSSTTTSDGGDHASYQELDGYLDSAKIYLDGAKVLSAVEVLQTFAERFLNADLPHPGQAGALLLRAKSLECEATMLMMGQGIGPKEAAKRQKHLRR